jgi:hypothetical protein
MNKPFFIISLLTCIFFSQFSHARLAPFLADATNTDSNVNTNCMHDGTVLDSSTETYTMTLSARQQTTLLNQLADGDSPFLRFKIKEYVRDYGDAEAIIYGDYQVYSAMNLIDAGKIFYTSADGTHVDTVVTEINLTEDMVRDNDFLIQFRANAGIVCYDNTVYDQGIAKLFILGNPTIIY